MKSTWKTEQKRFLRGAPFRRTAFRADKRRHERKSSNVPSKGTKVTSTPTSFVVVKKQATLVVRKVNQC